MDMPWPSNAYMPFTWGTRRSSVTVRYSVRSYVSSSEYSSGRRRTSSAQSASGSARPFSAGACFAGLPRLVTPLAISRSAWAFRPWMSPSYARIWPSRSRWRASRAWALGVSSPQSVERTSGIFSRSQLSASFASA